MGKRIIKYINPIFQNCNVGKICLKKQDNLINPYLGKCNYYKCKRNIYLRIGTIFEYNNKTPASVLFYILKQWLIECYNSQKIAKNLIEKYSLETVNIKFINSFLHSCREAIAMYIRTNYKLDPLANRNDNHHICIDESLFSHSDGIQIWVVGMINAETKEIRLEMVDNRNANTLKNIIEKHVLPGNIVVSDSCAGYSFLDNINSGYVHHIYNHGRGNFGYVLCYSFY